jgi:hypothetical protein
VVDRDLTRYLSSPGYRAYLAIARGEAREFVILLALVSHCFKQMTAWEKLAPNSPDHRYVTGEYYFDVYLALYDAARTQFDSQWYGSAGVRRHNVRFPRLRRLYIRFRRTRWIAMRACQFALGNATGPFGALDTEFVNIRTFARTEVGYLALVPVGAKVGDSIAICQGGKLPLVLCGDGLEEMRLVGESYVHGMMEGENYREEGCHAIRIF